MSAQPSALATHYICSICRQNVPLKDPFLIGETIAQKQIRVGKTMKEHLGQKHQREVEQMILAGVSFTDWLCSCSFEHNDAEFGLIQDRARAGFRKFTALPVPAQITNADIEATVDGQLCLKEHLTGVISPESIRDLRNAIVSLMQQMRDALVDSKG